MCTFARYGLVQAQRVLKFVLGAAAAWKGCFLQGDLAVQPGIATAAIGVGTFKHVPVPTLQMLCNIAQ
jgi:hypothetical protein